MPGKQDRSPVITWGSAVEGEGPLILKIAVPGQSLVRLKPVNVHQIQVAGPLFTEKDQFLHCQVFRIITIMEHLNQQKIKPVNVHQIQVAGPLLTEEDQFLHCQVFRKITIMEHLNQQKIKH
jgi:hypothetical protein